jgi:hypothetical protein
MRFVLSHIETAVDSITSKPFSRKFVFVYIEHSDISVTKRPTTLLQDDND